MGAIFLLLLFLIICILFVFLDFLCDDGRCKDEANMRRFLRLRKEEADAVSSEKEMIRDLLQFCQEASNYVKGG